jgi:quinol-cytochrome oxidoreductase complex cytochrome b subunit
VNLRFYYIASITKLILWLFIVIITYTSINIYEDPAIWISLWFIGAFITIWWFSFFLFLRGQKIFRKKEEERIIKDSYKLSLLFWIYSSINVLLLILWSWTKLFGIILLAGFILIHILLLENQNDKSKQ